MQIVGVPSPVCSPAVQFTIAHGQHPVLTLFEAGYLPLRPLSTQLVDDELVFTYLVRHVVPEDQPPKVQSFVREDIPNDVEPVPRQRIGAYALVVSDRGILGTVNSSITGAPGSWSLPGGGIDPGESPSQAAFREIFEETGQQIELDRLLSLESDHWIGHSTTGVLEDFHALRIIYAANCKTPSDPVVHDLGGSTQRADWVPVHSWRRLHWTLSSRALLARFARELTGNQSLK